MRLKLILLTLALVMTVFISTAKADLGLRIGSYTDADELFIGGEYIAPLATRTYINPNIEYVFVDNATFMTFNLDVHYDFYQTGRATAWAGAGLGIQYWDFEGDDNSSTETGLNILAGIGLLTKADVMPYVQLKIILGEYDDVVLGIGIRF